MRVLVTRPQPANAQLATALRTAGYEVDQCPSLLLRGREPSAPALARVHTADICVFVSVHAVQCAWPWLQTRLPQHCRHFAIGPATAAALRAVGVTAEVPLESASAEQLLRLPQLQRVHGQRVLIVRGLGGLVLLADTLHERGAEVQLLEVYERVPLAAADLHSHWAPPDCIAVSSGEGLQALIAAADALAVPLRTLPVLVPSKRVAALALELGVARVIVCAGAGDAAVLAALRQLSGQLVSGKQ